MTDIGAPTPLDTALLAGQVARLRTRISTSTLGSVQSLFAQHVTGQPEQPTPPAQQDDPYSARSIAAAGYALMTGTAAGIDTPLRDRLARLALRDQRPGDKIGFMFDPALLVGVTAAVTKSPEPRPEQTAWLRRLLEEEPVQSPPTFLDLVRAYCRHQVTGSRVSLPRLDRLDGVGELGLVLWVVAGGTADLSDRRDNLPDLTRRFLQALLFTDVDMLSIPHAATALAAIDHVATTSASRLSLGSEGVTAVLRAFPSCMERWRWDPDGKDPIRWRIDAEREVQDILWIMLRPLYPDLVYEDPLPKIGHSSYRIDLGVPSLSLIVEVKFARTVADLKKFEKEVMEDSVAYPWKTDRYRELIVFIYDDSTSVEHHETVRRDLIQLDGVTDVVIVSRPGRIPERDRRLGCG